MPAPRRPHSGNFRHGPAGLKRRRARPVRSIHHHRPRDRGGRRRGSDAQHRSVLAGAEAAQIAFGLAYAGPRVLILPPGAPVVWLMGVSRPSLPRAADDRGGATWPAHDGLEYGYSFGASVQLLDFCGFWPRVRRMTIRLRPHRPRRRPPRLAIVCACAPIAPAAPRRPGVGVGGFIGAQAGV
jgi:hypothetical protein